MTLKKPEKTAPKTKKPGHGFDVVPPSKVMPSPTARPVIMTTRPMQSDNTLTRAPSAPTVHKRIMVSQPPSGIATQEEIQSIGLEVPSGKTAVRAGGASAIQASALKVGNRPARPLMVKPVEAGPTIAELLQAKQQAAGKPPADDKVSDPAPTPTKPGALTKATIVKAAKPAVTTELVETGSSGKLSFKAEKVIAPPSVHAKPQPADNAEEETSTSEAPSNNAKSTNGITPAADTGSQPGDTKADDGPDDVGDSLDKDLGTPADPVPPPKAELYGGKSVLIVHESHPVREFMAGLLVFIIGLVVIAAGVNFLLDAGLIKTGYKIPHTNLLEP